MKRKLSDLLNTWLFVLLAGANLLVFNAIVQPWTGARLDLTQYKEHSLSAPTRKVLKALPDRVEIIALFSTNTHKLLRPLLPKIQDTLDIYQAESGGKVIVHMEDPRSDKRLSQLYEEFNIRPVPVPLESKYKKEVKSIFFHIVVRMGDQNIKYQMEDLIDVEEVNNELQVKLKDLEAILTRGIRKVSTSFVSLDSVIAQVSSPVKITYYKLPADVTGLPEDKKKEIEEAAQKLRESVEDLIGKFKTKVQFEEKDATTDAQLFMVEVEHGSRKVAFPLFTQLQDVSKSGVTEKVNAALKRVLPGFSRTLGLVAPTPQMDPMMMQMGRRPPNEFGLLENLLGEEYNVKQVDLSSGEPPLDVDVLLVVRPEDLSDKAAYAIDQYMMLGGRMVLLLDPGKLDMAALQQNKLMIKSMRSGLEGVLAKWGITMEDKLLADVKHIPYPLPREIQPGLMVIDEVPYPYFVRVEKPSGHTMVSSVSEVAFLWPGAFTVRKVGEKTRAQAVLSSSAQSWLVPLDPQAGLDVTPSPDKKDVAPATSSYPIAVAVDGELESAWLGQKSPLEAPSKDPADPNPDDEPEAPANPAQPTADAAPAAPGGSPAAPRTSPRRDRSPATRFVVVADADFVSEVGVKILEGRFPFSYRFLINALEWVQSDEEEIVTSGKGLPRPLDEISNTKKNVLQYAMWLGAWLFLALIFLTFAILRRRGNR
ncbi:Gldg family protein [Myxococcota bacterium]|nr:Gldg family protein [Myxococcota bacterium]MBU1412722.1 Gldg family protein [Myxococcota bacterium]MBU1510203.1 Gldg family protein [Myxococcota bacterium]